MYYFYNAKILNGFANNLSVKFPKRTSIRKGRGRSPGFKPPDDRQRSTIDV